ncbi:MAG: ABC transporter ATP-binding protein [Gemmataceae bacterium]|nr:ABC transporter ATP-binding protein [Gemmataceae bacterium]
MTLEFEAERKLGSFSYEASLEAADEIVVLFGHSGAGKSLTLQFIAGLLRPDRGRVAVDGVTVFDSAAKVDLPPQQRRVGYVVQELALFEHMTVAENVAFGMPRGRDRTAGVERLLSLLDLEGYGGRRPRTLSGGQRQRVALARALAREAPLRLLDEPFSALDDTLRAGMRRELLRLRSQLGLSILFVTHDLREAHFLADRIAVFDAGRLLQLGLRDEVFRRPVSRRVAELTGVANIWPGVVVTTGPDAVCVRVEGAELRAARTPGTPSAAGDQVYALVRAERVNLRRDVQPREGRNQFPATIVAEFAYGSAHVLHLEPVAPGPGLEVEIAARPYEVLGIAGRKHFQAEIDPLDIHLVPRA